MTYTEKQDYKRACHTPTVKHNKSSGKSPPNPTVCNQLCKRRTIKNVGNPPIVFLALLLQYGKNKCLMTSKRFNMILQGSVQCPLKSKDKFPIDFNECWSVPILFAGVSFCFILVVKLWLPAARLITCVDIPSPQPWGNIFHIPTCL